MDPHNDFDKHDKPPYNIAPATNTPYREVVMQRAEAMELLRAVLACDTWHDHNGHAYLRVPARSVYDLAAIIAGFLAAATASADDQVKGAGSSDVARTDGRT